MKSSMTLLYWFRFNGVCSFICTPSFLSWPFFFIFYSFPLPHYANFRFLFNFVSFALLLILIEYFILFSFLPWKIGQLFSSLSKSPKISFVNAFLSIFIRLGLMIFHFVSFFSFSFLTTFFESFLHQFHKLSNIFPFLNFCIVTSFLFHSLKNEQVLLFRFQDCSVISAHGLFFEFFRF